jgi:hypothetical protein
MRECGLVVGCLTAKVGSANILFVGCEPWRANAKSSTCSCQGAAPTRALHSGRSQDDMNVG